MKKIDIVAELEKRASNRPGKRIQWLFTSNVEVQNQAYIWFQPVTLAEYERAHSMALNYVRKNLEIDDALVVDQAINIELLAIAIRDEEDHDKQKFSAYQLRNWLTLDEIAVLEKQFNLVTAECSPVKIIDGAESLNALLAEVGVSGASAALTAFDLLDTYKVIDELVKRLKEYEPAKKQ